MGTTRTGARASGPAVRGALRLTAVGAAVLVLTTALATSADAGQPVTRVHEGVNLVCEGPVGGGGVQLAVDQLDAGGNVLLAVFDAGGHAYLYNTERTGTSVLDASTVTGSTPLLDDQERDAGTAQFALTFASAGPAEVEQWTSRTGNVRQQSQYERTPVLGEGTVTLPAPLGTVELSCSGQSTRSTVWTTQPDATTDRSGVITTVLCETPLDGGGLLVTQVEQGEGAFAAVSVLDGEDVLSGEDPAPVVARGSVTSEVPLWRWEAEQPDGTASVDLRLAVRHRDRFTLRHAVGKQVHTVEVLAVTGTVALPDGRVVAVDCEGERSTSHEQAASPNGPGASGPAPAHDAPDGALVLRPGGRDSTHTRAAVPAPEVPLWCYDEPPHDPGYLPGRTVWYRFSGTGSPVTVDTHGSGFNTTLAVYTVDGDDLVQVACADDHFRDTWQARAEVATDAGTQYLVQVGGVGGQSGPLRVALR